MRQKSISLELLFNGDKKTEENQDQSNTGSGKESKQELENLETNLEQVIVLVSN